MDHRIYSIPPGLFPLSHSKETDNRSETSDFKHILRGEQHQTTPVKISKHARERLQERDIVIDERDWQKISEKMGEAKRRGVTDFLVIIDH